MIQNEVEYNALLDALLPFAEQMLNKHGEFFPLAAVVGADDSVALVAGETSDESLDPAGLLDFLLVVLRQQATNQDCKAAGACVDVKVLDPRSQQKTDALHFIFEHRSGEALDVFFPYQKRFLRGYQFDKPFAGAAERRVF